jgi:DNA transposition AAA+ family ATPase
MDEEIKSAKRAERGDGINIARDRMAEKVSGDTEEEADLVYWLHGYAMDKLAGSRSALCEFVGVDWTTIFRVFTGTYGADLGKFCQRLRHLRAREVSRSEADFVETVVTRKVFAALDIARAQNSIVLITGASGRSKTHAVKEWQRRNNHGASLYIDCPLGGGLRPLLDEIAERAGMGSRIPNSMLMDRLKRTFDYRHTLIFDEVSRLLPSGSRTRNLHPLEFLRRLNDIGRCGIVLVATKIFSSQMESGPWSAWFEQLLGRIEARVDIPDAVGRREAFDITAAFNPEPESELVAAVRKVCNGPGRVRLAFTLLRHASMIAKAKGEQITAAHFQTAQDFRSNINRWNDE